MLCILAAGEGDLPERGEVRHGGRDHRRGGVSGGGQTEEPRPRRAQPGAVQGTGCCKQWCGVQGVRIVQGVWISQVQDGQARKEMLEACRESRHAGKCVEKMAEHLAVQVS